MIRGGQGPNEKKFNVQLTSIKNNALVGACSLWPKGKVTKLSPKEFFNGWCTNGVLGCVISTIHDMFNYGLTP
jgi:hypothetical protein